MLTLFKHVCTLTSSKCACHSSSPPKNTTILYEKLEWFARQGTFSSGQWSPRADFHIKEAHCKLSGCFSLIDSIRLTGSLLPGCAMAHPSIWAHAYRTIPTLWSHVWVDGVILNFYLMSIWYSTRVELISALWTSWWQHSPIMSIRSIRCQHKKKSIFSRNDTLLI